MKSGDNTDLCYNELSLAPYANGVDANGFSVYDDEGPMHCHGFAWSTDDQDVSSRLKANALFFVSMYDHMHNRGYVGNVPGSPMCGCVEDVSGCDNEVNDGGGLPVSVAFDCSMPFLLEEG